MQTSFWNETIRFGDLEVPRFMVAPLDGVTDSPLRQLIRRFSKTELMFTEMRHVAGVCNAKNIPALFAYKPEEQPLAYQVSANKVDWIEGAVERVIEKKFCMLNLNVGCPARQVVRSGSGSSLMADPERLATLIKAFQKAINGRIPFTIKIRAGFKEPNGLYIAQMAEDLGCAGLMIHPRLQTGGFTAPLDYDMVASIKQKVNLPLVFSGNINNFKRAKKVYERTGVDGFMIGRALWGAPWKMFEMTEEAEGRSFSITVPEMVKLAIEHLTFNIELYGPRGVHHFKKQLPQYIRGVHGAAQLRATLVRAQSAQEMAAMLHKLILEETVQ